MRIGLCLCMCVAFAKMGCSQEAPERFGRALKLYGLTDYQAHDAITRYTDTSATVWRMGYSQWRVLQPTVAYQWHAGEGNYHELELIQFQLSASMQDRDGAATGSGDLLEMALSFRYEYQWSFDKDPTRKVSFSLGLGFNPYFFQYSRRPVLTTEFPDRDQIFGLRAFAVPRLSWHISPRFYVDFNLPFCLAEYRYHGIYNEDPALPLDERKLQNTAWTALPNYFSGRIGIGVKL